MQKLPERPKPTWWDVSLGGLVELQSGQLQLRADRYEETPGKANSKMVRSQFYGSYYWVETQRWMEEQIQNSGPSDELLGPRVRDNGKMCWYYPQTLSSRNDHWFNLDGEGLDANGDVVNNEAPTIDHRVPIVQQWNSVGRDSDQAFRRDYYNGEGNFDANLSVVPARDNFAKAQSDKAASGGYTLYVGKDFKR
jgi:hypothetical protein